MLPLDRDDRNRYLERAGDVLVLAEKDFNAALAAALVLRGLALLLFGQALFFGEPLFGRPCRRNLEEVLDARNEAFAQHVMRQPEHVGRERQPALALGS